MATANRVGKPLMKTTAHGATTALLSNIVVIEDDNIRGNTEPGEELIRSVKQDGCVTNPILVCWYDTKKTKLRLVDGARRYNASVAVGLKEIKVYHCGFLTEAERIEISLTANENQKPWNKAEKIKGIKKAKAIGKNKKETSVMLRVSEEYVAHVLRVDAHGSKKLKKATKKPTSEGGMDPRVSSRASKLPKEEQDELVEKTAGKTRDQAMEEVEKAEDKLGVTRRGPKMKKPKQPEKREPQKRKCSFNILPNADELCESIDKRCRTRLSHNARDVEANAMLRVLDILNGNSTMSDVFGWE